MRNGGVDAEWLADSGAAFRRAGGVRERADLRAGGFGFRGATTHLAPNPLVTQDARMRFLTCLAALLVVGCAARDVERTTVSDSSTGLRLEPGSTAGVMALELWQLRPGVTLREWQAAHPDDAVAGNDTSGTTRPMGDWCAAAQRDVSVGNRTVTRTAFFYVPPPGDLSLPDGEPDLVKRCELGLVWLRTPYDATSDANAAGDSLSRHLGTAFGGAVGRPVRFYGSATWHRVQRYRHGEAVVVTAAREEGAARVLFGFAFLPISGLSVDEGARPRWRPAIEFDLDSAGALAAGDSTALQTLLAVAADAQIDSARRTDPAPLVRALTRWLSATEELPPPRRAAALYVADRVLDQSSCAFGLCDDAGREGRAALQAAGAAFGRSYIGAPWIYERSWLTLSRMLDRDGPIGQRILLAQMRRAFDFSSGCRDGADGFRRVIANGERYLTRVPDSPIAAEVHFELGEAYRDIVALARGAGGIDADSSRYGGEAAEAGRMALVHYGEAMKAGAQSPVAQEAWRRAFWLKAGLEPRDLRFYCIG